MKITPKFQQGGTSPYIQFFSVYQPIDRQKKAASSSEGKSKKDSDDSKSKLTEKDFYTMLKDLDGLPNEMEAIAKELSTMMRYESLTGIDSSTLSSQYISNLYQVKHAKFNKEQYNDAYNRSKENNSLNDIAINLNGTVIVQDQNGAMSTITPQQYVANRDQYTPVTNSNLLWLRAHNPHFVNNNQVFEIVENGIGLETVQKMVDERFKKLGSAESSQDMYISKEAAKGSELLNDLLQQGPDGYYKVQEKGTLPQLQQQQINAALHYIYTMLPDNAKTRIRLETANGTEQEALDVIQQFIWGQQDYKHETNLQYLNKKDTEGSDSKSGNMSDLLKENGNAALRWVTGLGHMESYIMNPGSSNSTYVYGNVGTLTDENGHPVKQLSSLSEATSGEWAGVFNTGSISIGGELVPAAGMEAIVLKNNSVMSVDYPCEARQDGKIVPAISQDIQDRKKQADSELKEMGIDVYNPADKQSHYQEINDVYQKNGLGIAYDSNGNPAGNWHRFAVLNAYADSKMLGMDPLDRNPLLKEVTNDAIIDKVIEKTGDKKFDRHWGLLNMDVFHIGNKDFIYEGLVWIPVFDDIISATNGNARNMKIGDTNEADRLRQNLENQNRAAQVLNRQNL